VDPARRALLVGAVAAAAAGSGWIFLRGGEEDRIKDQLMRLAAALRFSEGTNALVYLARVKETYGEILADDVHVSAPELPGGVRGRADLANATASLARRFRSVDVELRELEIKMDEVKATAQVGATGVLVGGEHGGETQRDRRALTFHVRKVEGVWRVASLTVWGRDS